MRSRRKLFLIIVPLLLLFATLLGDPPNGNAQQLRDNFRKVKQSVVKVRTQEMSAAALPQVGMVSSAELASGVLISDDGKVLTAAHVVQVADKISVEFADGQIVTARVLSSAPSADVALLQLDAVPSGVTPARLGDSDKVDVGDEVFVVGASYGLSQTLTVGHVSGRVVSKSSLASMLSWEFLQTDAAINSGNSGGPMFNSQGEVVGIVSSILSHSGGFEGIGFAATTKRARLLLERKPIWLGMEGILVEGAFAEVLNIPQKAGFLVQRVAKGAPACRLGLRPGTARGSIEGNDLLLGGDIILSLNGINILEDNASLDSIYDTLSNLKPGDSMVAKVLRAGQVIELSMVIS